MSQNNEIEAKIILPQSVYQALCADFPVKNSFHQENYYFDTDDGLLKQNNISCRIRLFSERAEQTLKVPNPEPVQNNFHEAIEITDDLTLSAAQDLIEQGKNNHAFCFENSVGHYLETHFKEHTELHLQTFSKTYRTLAKGPQDCELTLDRNQYPDQFVDYELEIENSDPALIKQVLEELKRTYGFTQTAATSNQAKIARAFKHRAKM